MTTPISAAAIQALSRADARPLDAACLITDVLGRPVDRKALDGHFDVLATGAERWVAPHVHPRARIEGLCAWLAGEAGFLGDPQRYDEVDRSRIDVVLETGLGIPITLAVVYLEVAERLQLAGEGVSFPGHFLVRFAGTGQEGASEPLIVDPFAGRLLTPAECAAFAERARVGPGHLPGVYPAASAADVFLRMLNNLASLGRRESRWHDALVLSDTMLMVAPQLVAEEAHRAQCLAGLGRPELAAEALERLLAHIPEGPQQQALRKEIERLRGSPDGPGPVLH